MDVDDHSVRADRRVVRRSLESMPEQPALRRRDRPDAAPGESEPVARVRQRDPAIPDRILEEQVARAIGRDHTPVAELRRPTRSSWRRVLLAGMLVCALLVGYYLVTLWQVYSAGRTDQSRPVDAIVVMGAAQYDGRPSPQLAARLDHVVDLWPQGLAETVVVTGGNQPGDRFTEAAASASYLVERGVPESAIVLEDEGSTSFESLDRVAQLLEQRSGFDDISVLIVTDPFHTLRSRLIAEEVGLTSASSPTTTSVVTGARSLERHLWEAGGVAIGRVTGFEWLSNVTD
jgi:uncharacterized SAM-binding protein YcdF (DUF218 family)